ncbi:MAG: hypothetical protein U0792_14295 [Gemmataceae bacterium]
MLTVAEAIVEELIFLLLQILLDIVPQLFGGLGFDVATSRRSDREAVGCGTVALFAICGGVCGGLSIFIAPNPLLPNAGLRIVNLFVAPLLAGGISYLFARTIGLDEGPEQSHHFWRGFWFALAFGIVRFACIHR